MDDWEPQDPQAKGIRFGCGFLFGGVVVFFTLAHSFFSFASPFWIAVAGGALLCGFLAVRFGDRFFRALIEFLRW